MKKMKKCIAAKRAKSAFFLVAALFLFFTTAGSAGAADAGKYPFSTIRIMVPASAGGSLAGEIRAISPFFEKYLGARAEVEYVTGADGLIAYNKFPDEKNDGSTIMHFNLISATNLQLTRNNARYDVTKFALIGSWNAKYQVLIVHPDSWKTFGEFLQDAHKKTLSLAGTGGHTILNVNVMQAALGVKFNMVPYKGSGEGIAATAGKHVDFLLTYETVPKPMIQAGKLRALAVLSRKPNPILPGVPNLTELKQEKIPPLPALGTFAAPPGTPKAVLETIQKALAKAATDPEFLAVADKMGIYVDLMSTAETYETAVEQKKIVNDYKEFLK